MSLKQVRGGDDGVSFDTSSSFAEPPTNPDTLLTTQQLAEIFQTSPRTIEGWRVTGGGPPFLRVGGRSVRYRWGAALEWLKPRLAQSTSEEAV